MEAETTETHTCTFSGEESVSHGIKVDLLLIQVKGTANYNVDK